MNFQVPQFIEEKPKLVWFLNIQQFLILLGGGGICAISYYIFALPVFIGIAVIVGSTTVLLAIGKVNGQSAVQVLRAAFRYAWQPRRYTWQRTFEETTLDTSGIEKIEALRKRMGIQERLKSIALSVTTGKIFSGLSQPGQQKSGEQFQVVTYLTGEKKVAKKVDYK